MQVEQLEQVPQKVVEEGLPKKEEDLSEVKIETTEDHKKKETDITPSETHETPSKLAANLYQDDKLLQAARVLRNHVTKQDLTADQLSLLGVASKCEELVDILERHEQDEDMWTKIGGRSAKKTAETDKQKEGIIGDTTIHYKTNKAHTELQCRVDTPIDESLLVPLISVLNESQLYHSWLPSWRGPPKFGIRRVIKLKQVGRCSQIIIATFDPPWPLSPREVVLKATAVDDITENGDIVIRLDSLQEGDEDGLVPAKDDPNIIRMQFTGGFLLRKCPTDPKRMVVKFFSKIHSPFGIPSWFIHFLVKTVFWTCWNMLLNVAVGVRDGKRPLHKEAIDEKKEVLYEWVQDRIEDMLSFKH